MTPYDKPVIAIAAVMMVIGAFVTALAVAATIILAASWIIDQVNEFRWRKENEKRLKYGRTFYGRFRE